MPCHNKDNESMGAAMKPADGQDYEKELPEARRQRAEDKLEAYAVLEQVVRKCLPRIKRGLFCYPPNDRCQTCPACRIEAARQQYTCGISREQAELGGSDESDPLIASPYLFPHNVPQEGRFLMWHVAGYYDESDDIERGYAVAGFVGHQHDCVHLDLAWRDRILDKYELEYFKASELSTGTEQFAKFRDDPSNVEARFSQREKDLFQKIKIESIDLILEFNLLIGVGCVLVLPDYHRIHAEYQRMGKTLPAPYFFCAQIVMMESGFIMNRINDSIPQSIHGLLRPVFDSHEEYSGRGKQMFDEFHRKNPISSAYLLPPHYESDKQYLVLQAADTLAFECRRLLWTTDFDQSIPERRAMKRLKERIYKIYKLNYAALKAIMEAQEPDKIPLDAEVHNRHELVKELDAIEKEAGRVREVRQHNEATDSRSARRAKGQAGRGKSSKKAEA